MTIKLDDETSSSQSGSPSAGGNGIKVNAQSNMEVRYTLKDFSGINGKEPSNVTTLGYYEKPYDIGIFETSKPIQEFTSECFCIYTQSFKIENGDWVIVDGNWARCAFEILKEYFFYEAV